MEKLRNQQKVLLNVHSEAFRNITWQPDPHREGTSYSPQGDALGSFVGWALRIVTNTNVHRLIFVSFIWDHDQGFIQL